MKKVKIFSGAAMVPLLICYLSIEIGCLALCFSVKSISAYFLLTFWSIMLVIILLVANRAVTIVTYDPKNKIVTRRGFLGGFHRELLVTDIIRTEIRKIPKEQEFILLLDHEESDCFDSLSIDMPIRVPNTVKGRDFVSLFYNHRSDVESRETPSPKTGKG